jgi:hypothetical protein
LISFGTPLERSEETMKIDDDDDDDEDEDEDGQEDEDDDEDEDYCYCHSLHCYTQLLYSKQCSAAI